MEDSIMNIKFKNRLKRILSSVIVVGMAMSLIPSVSFAAQSNEYVDPADVWIEANGRTSEFDINATVTTGTLFCPICDMPTTNISYRVPEYTRTTLKRIQQQRKRASIVSFARVHIHEQPQNRKITILLK